MTLGSGLDDGAGVVQQNLDPTCDMWKSAFMGKGHYQGGSTLIGFGTTTKSRTRRGGVGGKSPAERQQVRNAEKKRKQAVANRIKTNEKLVKNLSDKWLADKGRAHYERLVVEERAKVCSLAEALRDALSNG